MVVCNCLFERSSFGLALSTTCLCKQELNNFRLVFHLFAVAMDTFWALFTHGKLILNVLFLNLFTFNSHFLLCADWPKSDSSVNREPQGAPEVEFKLLRHDYKLSPPPTLFHRATKAPQESLLAGYCFSLDYALILLGKIEKKLRLVSLLGSD